MSGSSSLNENSLSLFSASVPDVLSRLWGEFLRLCAVSAEVDGSSNHESGSVALSFPIFLFEVASVLLLWSLLLEDPLIVFLFLAGEGDVDVEGERALLRFLGSVVLSLFLLANWAA